MPARDRHTDTAWVGKDGPDHRAWRAAVLLGLALIAGAFALALPYPFVAGPGCPCRDRDGRLVLVVASSHDAQIAMDAAQYVANGALGARLRVRLPPHCFVAVSVLVRHREEVPAASPVGTARPQAQRRGGEPSGSPSQ